MSYLKRSWLLLLVVFLAACGTQTQLPEVALDEETNIEVTSNYKAPVNFKKIVEGPAPKGAKYKVQLICSTKDKHKRVVLRQTVELTAKNKYSHATSYYSVAGRTCVVREVDNKHYDTGDWVHIKVTEKGKKHPHVDNTYEGGKTVTSKSFHPGKGRLTIVVTNKYKTPTPVPNEKTKLEFNKFYYEGHTQVKPDGKSTFYLICRIGHEDKEVGRFYFSKHDGYYYQGKYQRGLDCYLKESFEDAHYDLIGVHFAASHNVGGKWHGNYYVEGDFSKDDKGHFVSKRFTIPAKGHLKFIIKDKLAKKAVVKPKLELIVKKQFSVKDGSHAPNGTTVDVELVCNNRHVKSYRFVQGGSLEQKIELHEDYSHCVLKESFYDEHYKLHKVYFIIGSNHTSGNVSNDGKHATSQEFNLKTDYKKLIIVIKNELEKREKPKLELEIKKEFKLGYNGPNVHPNPKEFELILICGGKEVFSTTKTHDKAYLYPDDVQGKHCELKEVFKDDHYKAFQYSVAYDDGVAPKTTYNDCNTDKEDWCEFSRYDVNAKATKLVIIVTDNVKKKTKLEVIKKFREQYNGYDIDPGKYTLELVLECKNGTTVNIGSNLHYTAYVTDLHDTECRIKERFVGETYDLKQVSVDYGGKDPTYNDAYAETFYTSYFPVGDAKELKLIIINRVEPKPTHYPHA